MTERLRELLAKLAEFEPGVFGAIEAYLEAVNLNPTTPLGGYILQGVIQDAITAANKNGEARDWEFSITATQMSYGPIYSAAIWANYGWILHEGEARTPAEAILAAYIAAMEST